MYRKIVKEEEMLFERFRKIIRRPDIVLLKSMKRNLGIVVSDYARLMDGLPLQTQNLLLIQVNSKRFISQ